MTGSRPNTPGARRSLSRSKRQDRARAARDPDSGAPAGASPPQEVRVLVCTAIAELVGASCVTLSEFDDRVGVVTATTRSGQSPEAADLPAHLEAVQAGGRTLGVLSIHCDRGQRPDLSRAGVVSTLAALAASLILDDRQRAGAGEQERDGDAPDADASELDRRYGLSAAGEAVLRQLTGRPPD